LGDRAGYAGPRYQHCVAVIAGSGRFFEKKLCKKLLFPQAFARPRFGHSKAGGIKVFWLFFFKKVTAFYGAHQ
jgi:hypothetical protein